MSNLSFILLSELSKSYLFLMKKVNLTSFIKHKDPDTFFQSRLTEGIAFLLP